VVQNPCKFVVGVVFQKYQLTVFLKSTLNVSPTERYSTRFIQNLFTQYKCPIDITKIDTLFNYTSVAAKIYLSFQARKAQNGVTIIINGRTVTFQTGRAMVTRLSRKLTRRMRAIGTVTRSDSTMLKGGGKR